jgi:hypothetical protein
MPVCYADADIMAVNIDIIISVLLIITFAYAIFDLFNKREVPNVFAYISVAVAFILCLTYWNTDMLIGFAIAAFIAASGYALYKKGFLGAGDVFELITISLLLPQQPAPLLSSAHQLGMPFVFSVFISSGYFAVIIIVLYYILAAKRSPMEKSFKIEKRKAVSSTVLLSVYIVLILVMHITIGVGISGTVLLLLLAVPSSIMLVYERLINYRMVSLINPNELTQGDMIATNLMSTKEIGYFSKRSKAFGRLATSELIKDLKNVRRKLPVYRNAVPLAAFFFIGVVFSLLFGNLIFLIIKM